MLTIGTVLRIWESVVAAKDYIDYVEAELTTGKSKLHLHLSGTDPDESQTDYRLSDTHFMWSERRLPIVAVANGLDMVRIGMNNGHRDVDLTGSDRAS